MTGRALVLAAAGALAGCPAPVDTTGLPSAEGYRDWPDPIVTTTPIPAHGDTYRVIFANEVARRYAHAGPYPLGTVLVKEIFNKTSAGGPGDLRYIAIMRRVGDAPTTGYADLPADQIDDGWLFSEADGPGEDEVRLDLCWAKCHRAAPVAGAWLDYGY